MYKWNKYVCVFDWIAKISAIVNALSLINVRFGEILALTEYLFLLCTFIFLKLCFCYYVFPWQQTEMLLDKENKIACL